MIEREREQPLGILDENSRVKSEGRKKDMNCSQRIKKGDKKTAKKNQSQTKTQG